MLVLHEPTKDDILARELLTMSQAAFSARFKGSAMKRAKRRGLARNAAAVIGNVGTVDDVPLLKAALAHDEPLVREHATWALTSIGTADARSAGRARPSVEDDSAVRSERRPHSNAVCPDPSEGETPA